LEQQERSSVPNHCLNHCNAKVDRDDVQPSEDTGGELHSNEGDNIEEELGVACGTDYMHIDHREMLEEYYCQLAWNIALAEEDNIEEDSYMADGEDSESNMAFVEDLHKKEEEEQN
jgi:hypothetical protein